MQCARSATIWMSSRPRTPYFVILWASLLKMAILLYIWILTQFHPFSSIFCLFPPHPLLTQLISPHHGNPKKAGVSHIDLSPPWGPLEGRGVVAILISPHHGDPPYGPWDHVPPHVWTDKSNSATTQDEAEDEAEVCVLCCQTRSTITVCGEYEEHYCAECVDTHTCGSNVVW